MRILVVGKGAVGGYFGGRLQESGEDVTFLVRKKSDHLIVESVHGNLDLPVKTIQAGEQADAFDLVLLSIKAYHLSQVLTDLKPYVGQDTIILPLLNGVSHIDEIAKYYPNTLGGLCFIESTLGPDGQVIQTSKRHDIIFGELNGEITPRAKAIYEMLSKASFKTVLSERIKTDLWNKYVFIATVSGITTLMNSAVGPIMDSPYGKELTLQLFTEISAIANAHGFEVYSPEKNLEISLAMGYSMKASMLRDLEKGLAVETDHFQGELLKLAGQYKMDTPLLKVVYTRLKVYEINRNQKNNLK
jgi:2-dehydropantoate 2-reductase